MSAQEQIAQLQRKLEAAEAREAQQRRENERLRLESRKTTLHEYLRNCHGDLYNSLRLADASMSSTGFTEVSGKYYPKWLRPWSEFETVLPRHLGFLGRICGEKQLFHQKSTTVDLGATIARKVAGNENAVETFERVAVEDPVAEIVGFLATNEEVRVTYDFAGLRFSGNLLELTQASDGSGVADDETSEGNPERRWRAGPNKRLASERKQQRPNTKPDGIGLRTRPGGGETLAFVYDYKAAHKVPIKHLRPAVAKEQLFFEVVARVNGVKLSSDDEVRHREKAEASVAMALTQVFNYMVTYGVSYGYVAAGRSLLLLYVDRNDPHTLYCHPCLPTDDAGELIDDVGELTDDWTDQLSRTTVTQLLSFCLLSFQSDTSKAKGQSLVAAWSMAKATLQRWPEPYKDTAYPSLEPTKLLSTSLSQTTDGLEFVSDVEPTSQKVNLRSQSSCKPVGMLPQRHEDDEDDKDDEKGHSARDISRSLPANKRKGSLSSGSNDEDVIMGDSVPTRQYCTQACLLGLKRGNDLDENCPNVSLHRSDGSSRHPIYTNQFADLVNQQLLQDPYRKCQTVDFWGKRGAIGCLFKLELLPYGYTFVGKGTLEGCLDRLEHEGRVYTRLDHLQGEVVPVHLGLVRLDPGYILPGFKFVVYMMLMSWAGEPPGVSVDDAETSKKKSLSDIWREGVDHGDDCNANYLWNAERCRMMIIDFDRARLFPLPKPQAVSRLAKRNRRGSSEAGGTRKRARDFAPRPLQAPTSRLSTTTVVSRADLWPEGGGD